MTLKIMSKAIKTGCLGSKFMSNTQGVSRKGIVLKDLSLKQCMVKDLFYALQYRNRSKIPATSKIGNFVIKVDDAKISLLGMSGIPSPFLETFH